MLGLCNSWTRCDRNWSSRSTRNPNDGSGHVHKQGCCCQSRRADQSSKERLLAFFILFRRNPGAQAHIEVGRRDHRLEASDQLAQRIALSLKFTTSRTNGEVRRSVQARPVPQCKFVKFTPRLAAISVSHNYTT